jgi:hypothetical protein
MTLGLKIIHSPADECTQGGMLIRGPVGLTLAGRFGDQQMRRVMQFGLVLAVALQLVLVGCVTETIHDTSLAPRTDAEEETAKTPQVDPNDVRIASIIESVQFDRGTKLLHELEWLVSQKGLAVPHVLKALPQAGPRTRANLLYVLGFTRTAESRQALIDHLGASETVVRYEAAAGLLHQGDRTAVPILIDFLGHPEKQLRYKAIESLRLGTGQDFGFQFAAADDVRAAAIVKWNEWWIREKGRLMQRGPGEETAGMNHEG